MTPIVCFEVGAPYPIGYDRNLRVHLYVENGALGMGLELVIDAPLPVELVILTKEPLRISMLLSAPVCWLVMTLRGLAYDAPYCVALEDADDSLAITSALSAWAASDARQRQIVVLHVIDGSTGVLAAVRVMSLSGPFMHALSKAVSATAEPTSDREQKSAIARDYARWPRVAEMVVAATASELAGRV